MQAGSTVLGFIKCVSNMFRRIVLPVHVVRVEGSQVNNGPRCVRSVLSIHPTGIPSRAWHVPNVCSRPANKLLDIIRRRLVVDQSFGRT